MSFLWNTTKESIRNIFLTKNILWHMLAIGITAAIVLSGLDWVYFKSTRIIADPLFVAAIVGFFAPFLVPIAMYLIGRLKKSKHAMYAAYAVFEAEALGYLVSIGYKAFTGRDFPPLYGSPVVDSSTLFHFGFLQGGIFWGWPSSHTVVAVAFAATVWVMYENKGWVRWMAVLYAVFIAIGTSMTIHWLSDSLAGIIIGIVVGTAVGNVVKKHLSLNL